LCTAVKVLHTKDAHSFIAFSGISRISSPLISDDTEATMRAVKAMGAKVDVEKDAGL